MGINLFLIVDVHFALLVIIKKMHTFPLVVSFYTQDTLYQLEVQNLIASCQTWGLSHHVQAIASFGSWEKNCAYKPFFLMQMLQKFQEPLFWVDADAVFVQKPQILAVFTCDVAVYMRAHCDNTHPSKIGSGSLYINNTPGAAKILELWGQKCIDLFSNSERTEEVWDQVALRDVLFAEKDGVRVGALPAEYMAIFDQPSCVDHSPVICHYQASRRLKKLINEC